MSYSFYVATRSPPVLRTLLDSLGLPDLRVEYEPPPDEPLPPGSWRVYREGLSTRSLELSHDEGKLGARLLVCSSPDVAELALTLCERLAADTGGLVEPEDDEPYAPDARPERFAGSWADAEFEHQARLIALMVDRQDPPSPLTMSGPRRPFHIGPRFLATLRAAGGDAGLPYHLLEAMRRVQYVDESRYYPARHLQVQDKESGKPRYSVSVYGPDQAYVFTRPTYLALVDGDTSFYVPADKVAEIAGSKHQWLDEHNSLVEPTPESEWPALLARARAHAVEPA